MELSVIIPTRNRCAILRETLDRLEAQCGDAEFEVVVVDDGSTDDTADVVRRRAAGSPFPLILIEQVRLGPGAARNRALSAVRAQVCLFIDDDTWPCAGLVARHAAFHRQHPEPGAALLGHVDVAARPAPTPFMRWFTHQHLGFAEIENPDDAGGHNFFSGNVSGKTDFIRDAGGFDEEFGSAGGHEDIDLGLRLQQQGMRLVYDRHAVVEHYQPVDLSMAIDRTCDIGRGNARFIERHPHRPVPRRPGARHRIKASTLTGLTALGLRSPRLKREVWRFLCHEAFREAFWREVDSRDERRDLPPPERLRIGRSLARLASRDKDARLPDS
jgi:glycosyltransferase involved in cell wall biosynthesis